MNDQPTWAPTWARYDAAPEDIAWLEARGFDYRAATRFILPAFARRAWAPGKTLVHNGDGWYWIGEDGGNLRPNPLTFTTPVLAYQHAVLSDWKLP